jgi:hypothetical protein
VQATHRQDRCPRQWPVPHSDYGTCSGGRVAPPVKAVISVDLAVSAFMPVWAAAAVGGTVIAHAPEQSVVGMSMPVWAAATAPLGCAAAHCVACLKSA